VSYFQDGVIGYGDAYIDPLTGASEDYTASINGIEVEAEIANIGPFSLKGNFTYIDAVLNYFNVQGTQAIPVSSQLPFQPSFLANFVFGYSYDPWALTANLVYNYNGDYPTILKLTPTDREVSRQEIHTFDLVLSKGIETDGVDYTIRAGVKNIFNAQDTYLLGDDTFSNDSIGRSYWTELQIAF
jgi:outer membrane receptor protein involved in Fe transport